MIDTITWQWRRSAPSPAAPSPRTARWTTSSRQTQSSSTCRTSTGTGLRSQLLGLCDTSTLCLSLSGSIRSYSVPEVRRPEQNWIFMSYETATNVRVRWVRGETATLDTFHGNNTHLDSDLYRCLECLLAITTNAKTTLMCNCA